MLTIRNPKVVWQLFRPLHSALEDSGEGSAVAERTTQTGAPALKLREGDFRVSGLGF